MRSLDTDVLIVGSGIAGLTFALKAAEYAGVLLATKKTRADSNTNYAQGGVAAVTDPTDSTTLHARDTLLAGAGLCHRRTVDELVREGPARVQELLDWGVRFSEDAGHLSLGVEAGHSRRRILHAKDLTGREIERALLVAAEQSDRIGILEDHLVWRLLTGVEPLTHRVRCTGALILDVERGKWIQVRARAVLLASGGSCYLYQHTTNPDIATGDGVALGYEVGAAVANLEFVQFHPTALFPAGERAHLISEAVRGEGAVLRRDDGKAFMSDYHPAGSLAPRDIVARAIEAEMLRSGEPHVWLDCSEIEPDQFGDRFPHILDVCGRAGLSPPQDSIPVVPAAHYQCGGLLADWDGRTTLPGLFAAGEVACTGIHGANRLASNSLLEAVVFSHRAATRLAGELPKLETLDAVALEPDLFRDGLDPEDIVARIRTLMWEKVGIIRSDARLGEARALLDEMTEQVVARDGTGAGAMRSRQAEFMLEVASLIVRCAQRRSESRGLHYTETYPHRDNENYLRDTVLAR